MRTTAAVATLIALTSIGNAETIRGRILDKQDASPVEGAVVHVAGPNGFETTVTSDADGRYRVEVAPGKYKLTFVQDDAATRGTLIVTEGHDTTFDVRMRVKAEEIIALEYLQKPAVLPVPKTHNFAKAVPPYSDAAIEKDAWTRAWLLLDVDETGKVTQLKFLKKPGYDLEPIAISEGFKMSFEPARDARGRAVRTFVIWPIEWPSMNFLTLHGGKPTRLPERKWLNGYSSAAWVPCKGSGPWTFTNNIASHKGYRDCSRPDMELAKSEPWIVRPD